MDKISAIASRRKQLGLSRQDLANKTGLSITTIANIESGNWGRVNTQTAKALSKALKMHTTVLLGEGSVTHRGRPPHSGGKVKKEPKAFICPQCHLATSRYHKKCTNCGEKFPKT